MYMAFKALLSARIPRVPNICLERVKKKLYYTKRKMSSKSSTKLSEPYNFALGASNVGNSKSLISPAASLRKKLILSLPRPLLTMLN